MSRSLALFSVFVAVAAADAAEFRAGQRVMGTVLRVTVVDDDPQRARRLAEQATAEARRWDDILTVWRAQGELAVLNSRAGAGPVRVGDDLATALRRMRSLTRATEGAFDPAVGPLVDLWRGSGPAPDMPPRVRRLDEVLKLRGNVATLAAGASLDPGGIGKGLALDAMAEQLRAAGARAAFLDFGGSTQLAVGAPADEPRGWAVALSGREEGTLFGVRHLHDAALSTSRGSGPGTESGPVVDPNSGRPAAGRRLVTVRARSATDADAWSTALVVRGREGVAAATAAGVEVLLEDERGVWAAPGWEW